MLQLIFEKIINYSSQVAIYALIVLAVGFLVWKFTLFYLSTKTSNDKLPKIEDTLNKLYTAFVTLNKVLLEKTVISQSCFSNENSPRVINDLGKKLFDQSGAKKVYEEISPILMIELKNKEFGSLLELEQSCLS